eukprot:TRINITY_DN2635_c3_g1_i2.p1 TRINITY_DN2635_c3_g1~~TRINITY_DN2635_c3_g1_i2.p1  ORF type:complete len:840 (-),score=353.86 TRINITY_DN2635_c3_g1_i2:62-2581(-)
MSGKVKKEKHFSTISLRNGNLDALSKEFGDLAEEEKPVTKDDFELLAVVGKGSFAKVMQVRKKDTGEIYAMKILQKSTVISKNQVAHTLAEKDILTKVEHPFVVRLHYAFQTKDKLYLILDFVNGGELYHHLRRDGRFSEERVRFYAAELVLAVAHLHSLNIMYRDIKAENVLLDPKGHIVITDFGISKEVREEEKTNTMCGTPEYLAPEILLGVSHGKAIDWWSLGNLIYEMLVGMPPFWATTVSTMYNKILTAEVRFPSWMSEDARSLLMGLLERDVDKRLGSKGAEEVKNHKFFQGIDWKKLEKKEVDPPFKPDVSSSLDTSQIDPEFTQEHAQDEIDSSSNAAEHQEFSGYNFKKNTKTKWTRGENPFSPDALRNGNGNETKISENSENGNSKKPSPFETKSEDPPPTKETEPVQVEIQDENQVEEEVEVEEEEVEEEVEEEIEEVEVEEEDEEEDEEFEIEEVEEEDVDELEDEVEVEEESEEEVEEVEEGSEEYEEVDEEEANRIQVESQRPHHLELNLFARRIPEDSTSNSTVSNLASPRSALKMSSLPTISTPVNQPDEVLNFSAERSHRSQEDKSPKLLLSPSRDQIPKLQPSPSRDQLPKLQPSPSRDQLPKLQPAASRDPLPKIQPSVSSRDINMKALIEENESVKLKDTKENNKSARSSQNLATNIDLMESLRQTVNESQALQEVKEELAEKEKENLRLVKKLELKKEKMRKLKQALREAEDRANAQPSSKSSAPTSNGDVGDVSDASFLTYERGITEQVMKLKDSLLEQRRKFGEVSMQLEDRDNSILSMEMEIKNLRKTQQELQLRLKKELDGQESYRHKTAKLE